MIDKKIYDLPGNQYDCVIYRGAGYYAPLRRGLDTPTYGLNIGPCEFAHCTQLACRRSAAVNK